MDWGRIEVMGVGVGLGKLSFCDYDYACLNLIFYYLGVYRFGFIFLNIYDFY